MKSKIVSALPSDAEIPLVNRSSSLPVPHSVRMLLVSGKIPVWFDNKLWSEPHKMKVVLDILHPEGFSPWFVFKQNWYFARNEQHVRTMRNWQQRLWLKKG